MSLIIGLTGGIGSGKSSVSKLFMELRIDVVDTDEIAHELTQSGGSAIPFIRKLFGEMYITSDGALDRKKMRQLVFADNDQRIQLEALLHPLILDETTRRIRQCRSPYTVVAVPLLFETDHFLALVHRVLVIDCDESLQIERTMARSRLSADEVKAIIKAQISRGQRLEKAHDVIINNRDIKHLREQVLQLHQYYLGLSAQNGLPSPKK